MSDRQTDTDAGRWMSYAQLAEMRGISKKAAQRLTLRHRWRRQPANDGGVLVWVPEGAATPGRQTARHDGQSDTSDITPAFETALAAIEAAHARELATLREQVASAEQARAAMRAMLEQFAGQLRDVDQIIKTDRARSDALLAETAARADRAEAAITGERARTDALRDRLEQAQAELAVAQHDAQAAQEAVAEVRHADIARQARGLVARLRAAWRGE